MILKLSGPKAKIGPYHHGRKMSLKAFEFAQVEEGYLVELARGYVVVSEVPNYPHALTTAFIRDMLGAYRLANPRATHLVLDGASCKLLIPDWRTWVPELVIEVVSEGSRDRDYTEKRDEYWTLGVKEYWVVDAKLQQVLVLRRGRSQWTEKTLGPADVCETKLLPGFKLPCKAVFEAGGDAGA